MASTASDNNEETESKIPRDAALPKSAEEHWALYFKKHPNESFPKVGDIYDLWTGVHHIGYFTVEAVDKGVVTGTAVIYESPLFERHYKRACLVAAFPSGETLKIRDAGRVDLPAVKNVLFRSSLASSVSSVEVPPRMSVEHIEKVMAGFFPNAPPRVLTLTIGVPDGGVDLPPKPYRHEDYFPFETFVSVEARVKDRFPRAKMVPWETVAPRKGRAVFKNHGDLDDLLDSIERRCPSIAEWSADYDPDAKRWEFFYTTLAC